MSLTALQLYLSGCLKSSREIIEVGDGFVEIDGGFRHILVEHTAFIFGVSSQIGQSVKV